MVEADRQTGKKISYEDAAELVRNKGGFYDTMLRNGWYMPSKHSELCSLKWMRKVKKFKIYSPKRVDLNLSKQCWNPPPLRDLLDKLENSMMIHMAQPPRPTPDMQR